MSKDASHFMEVSVYRGSWKQLNHVVQSLRIESASTRPDKLKRSRQSHDLAKTYFFLV